MKYSQHFIECKKVNSLKRVQQDQSKLHLDNRKLIFSLNLYFILDQPCTIGMENRTKIKNVMMDPSPVHGCNF